MGQTPCLNLHGNIRIPDARIIWLSRTRGRHLIKQRFVPVGAFPLTRYYQRSTPFAASGFQLSLRDQIRVPNLVAE